MGKSAEMEIVNRPHARNLVRWAGDKPEVLVLSADLTASCEADAFRDAYPDRFFSLGMGEQNMMGFAAGLAREGFYPYVHTFAVFVSRRPFDQVAMSIAYPNLPVRLMGFLPGISTPGGVTHQAIDDLGLMRLLPNITVLECGDATDVESVLDVAQGIDGPVYVRMLRGDVPRLFPADQPMRVGQARVLQGAGPASDPDPGSEMGGTREGPQPSSGTAGPRAAPPSMGCDVAVLSSGICTEQAMRAATALTTRGVSLRHLHVSTLKPFDDALVLQTLASARRGVISMENHSVIGGLGSAVAEVMAQAGAGIQLIRLGLQDQYAHGASTPYLQKKYGLDAGALVRAVEKLMNTSFELSDADLLTRPPAESGSPGKAEDL